MVPNLPMPEAIVENWLVLVADDVPSDRAVLVEAIREYLHGGVSRVERVEIDDALANAASLAVVKGSPDRTVVVIPAAKDPILGIRKTLQQILAAGTGRECAVLLHGNPARLNLWRAFANASRLDVDLIIWPAA